MHVLYFGVTIIYFYYFKLLIPRGNEHTLKKEERRFVLAVGWDEKDCLGVLHTATYCCSGLGPSLISRTGERKLWM